jgi:hypothetical protein
LQSSILLSVLPRDTFRLCLHQPSSQRLHAGKVFLWVLLEQFGLTNNFWHLKYCRIHPEVLVLRRAQQRKRHRVQFQKEIFADISKLRTVIEIPTTCLAFLGEVPSEAVLSQRARLLNSVILEKSRFTRPSEISIKKWTTARAVSCLRWTHGPRSMSDGLITAHVQTGAS